MHRSLGRANVCFLAAFLAFACKRQPVRSASSEQSLHSSNLENLSSSDGQLRSYASKAQFPNCHGNGESLHFFSVAERKFYRCVDQSLTEIRETTILTDECVSFKVSFDVSAAAGAQPETDVKFFGMRCGGSTYLIKADNGLMPTLSSVNTNLGDKEILMRTSYLMPKNGLTSSVSQPAILFLERPTSIMWKAIPRSVEVSPGGNAGQGKFALLSINSDSILCSYRSDSMETYQLLGCWEGATNDSMSGDGVSGGKKIDLGLKTPQSIDSLKFTILGAEPGFITTAIIAINFE